MYEMKGALSGHAGQAGRFPASLAPRASPPGPGTRSKHRFPGLSCAPGLPPDGARFQR